MTRNKDFKKIVRARMRKTGESYVASRQQLLRKKNGAAAGSTSASPRGGADADTKRPAPTLDVSKAGMTDEAVRAKTGKTWAEWVAVLDAAGADRMPHRDIAEHLNTVLGVADWWSQTVTVGYERIRGLREPGQRRDGGYEINKSKTYPVALATLYRAFSDTRTRNRWLPGVTMTIRTAAQNKSMRVTWADGGNVHLMFYAKGTDRSYVTVQHGRLTSRADADRMRAFWTERLAALGVLLPPSGAASSKPRRRSR